MQRGSVSYLFQNVGNFDQGFLGQIFEDRYTETNAKARYLVVTWSLLGGIRAKGSIASRNATAIVGVYVAR